MNNKMLLEDLENKIISIKRHRQIKTTTVNIDIYDSYISKYTYSHLVKKNITISL
jgi:hypothetical protein